MMMSSWELVLRLLLSAIVGGLIGIERESTNRPAGLRTHVLVTIGSTLIMMISQYGFMYTNTGIPMGDPGRIAAQVVSGIGFLGAGTILQYGNRIKGLTTAASIWVCGGIGLAIGNGFYLGAIVTTLVVLVTLRGLGFIEKNWLSKNMRTLTLAFYERPGVIGDVGQVIGRNNILIKEISITGDGEEEFDDENTCRKVANAIFHLKLSSDYSSKKFFAEILDIPSVISAQWEDGKRRYASHFGR